MATTPAARPQRPPVEAWFNQHVWKDDNAELLPSMPHKPGHPKFSIKTEHNIYRSNCCVIVRKFPAGPSVREERVAVKEPLTRAESLQRWTNARAQWDAHAAVISPTQLLLTKIGTFMLNYTGKNRETYELLTGTPWLPSTELSALAPASAFRGSLPDRFDMTSWRSEKYAWRAPHATITRLLLLARMDPPRATLAEIEDSKSMELIVMLARSGSGDLAGEVLSFLRGHRLSLVDTLTTNL